MSAYLPQLLSGELQLVIAIVLGIAFGFVLEQAGFSDSRRLAGLFYGYDFVVLRVFFTAGVTAMVGVSLLAAFGLVSLEMIYVNPLFVRSALAGGAVMGLGFILGGFCPGTSVCSAAIGRLDGMVFVFGTLAGVLLYAELYPLLAGFVTADAHGGVTVPELLGISRGFFIVMVAAVAAAAFILTSLVEDRVNGRPLRPAWRNRRAMGYVAAALAVAALVLVLPDRKSRALAIIAGDGWEEKAAAIEPIELEELVTRLVAGERELRLIDVRPREEFDAGHLPAAVSIPLDSLANGGWRGFLREPARVNVFYCSNGDDARRAAVLSRALGDSERMRIYCGGWDEYRARMLGDDATDPAFLRLRQRALPELERIAAAAAQPVKPKPRTAVKGGC